MKRSQVALEIGLFCTLVFTCVTGRADADELSRELADQSYRAGEARRLNAMSRQLDLNYRMLWSSGYAPAYSDAFEPWPRVPGDIWGYPTAMPIEHPIGQEEVQIGPNRWLSRPIYANTQQAAAGPNVIDDRAPLRQPNRPMQAPARVELPGPSDRDENEPVRRLPRRKAKRSDGPREF